jgi:hypothetical protein
MAPLGTEVLIHMKPNRRSTWEYHASKAWYLSHSPNHYHCIWVLMADTSGERTTDTFRFNHHSIPVPKIMATNRILDATAHLTAAIEGVQEAPPDKLTAIQALRTLLLGEVPPPEPTPAPVTALRPTIDKEPEVIWSPNNAQQPVRDTGTNSPASAPPIQQDRPAIIEDDSDDDSAPPTLIHHSPLGARRTLDHHRTHSPPRTHCAHDQLRLGRTCAHQSAATTTNHKRARTPTGVCSHSAPSPAQPATLRCERIQTLHRSCHRQ